MGEEEGTEASAPLLPTHEHFSSTTKNTLINTPFLLCLLPSFPGLRPDSREETGRAGKSILFFLFMFTSSPFLITWGPPRVERGEKI